MLVLTRRAGESVMIGNDVIITVLEALRAFDIIFVLNVPRKTEVLSILTTNNLLGEGGGNVGRDNFGTVTTTQQAATGAGASNQNSTASVVGSAFTTVNQPTLNIHFGPMW